MLKHLKHNEIDKQKWNNCIENSLSPFIYAFSDYLDIVSPNWEALVYDDYLAVMPLPVKKKYGFTYLMQPLFTQQLGIFSEKKIDKKTYNDFLKYIRYGYLYFALNLNFNNVEPAHYISFFKRTNLILNLNKTYNELQQNFSKNTKRNIKKSISNNLIINKEELDEDIISFIKKYSVSDISQNIALLELLLNKLSENKMLEIYTAYSNKQLQAVSVFTKFANRFTYLIPVSNAEGKNTKAMFGIINEFLTEHSSSLNVLDFEGSNIEGIKRFYEGFGAEHQDYYHIYRKVF